MCLWLLSVIFGFVRLQKYFFLTDTPRKHFFFSGWRVCIRTISCSCIISQNDLRLFVLVTRPAMWVGCCRCKVVVEKGWQIGVGTFVWVCTFLWPHVRRPDSPEMNQLTFVRLRDIFRRSAVTFSPTLPGARPHCMPYAPRARKRDGLSSSDACLAAIDSISNM